MPRKDMIDRNNCRESECKSAREIESVQRLVGIAMVHAAKEI